MRIDYLPPLPIRIQRERRARFYATGTRWLLLFIIASGALQAYILFNLMG